MEPASLLAKIFWECECNDCNSLTLFNRYWLNSVQVVSWWFPKFFKKYSCWLNFIFISFPGTARTKFDRWIYEWMMVLDIFGEFQSPTERWDKNCTVGICLPVSEWAWGYLRHISQCLQEYQYGTWSSQWVNLIDATLERSDKVMWIHPEQTKVSIDSLSQCLMPILELFNEACCWFEFWAQLYM